MKEKKKKKEHRFAKLISEVVKKSSPSKKDDSMGIQDQADAISQEGKKAKLKPEDLDPRRFR